MFAGHRIPAWTPKPAEARALIVACLFFAVFTGAGASYVLAQVSNAKPTGYVSDYAGVLSMSAKR